MLEFQLPPGSYCIGDPYLFLLPGIVNEYFGGKIMPGFYNYEGFPFLIDCTGFDEGSFLDADRTEYVVYYGLLGVLPMEICQSRDRLGKQTYFPLPVVVGTDGEGHFEIGCGSYKLVLETSLENFSEESFS